MKNSILALVVCSLLVFFTADIVLADWYMQFDAEASQFFRRHGIGRRWGPFQRWGPFATKEQCEAYRKSRPWYERHHSCCVGSDSPSSKISVPRKGGGVHRDRQYQDEQKQLIREKEERERELERQREFDLGKRGLLKTLKRGSASQPPRLKGPRDQQGVALKPAYNERQIETLQALKQLHSSAYWALSAAEKAREGVYEVASEYSEYSAQAKNGSITPGYPEIDFAIPEVPPPVHANPQFKLYNVLIEKTTKLIPQFQKTDQKIENLRKQREKARGDIAQKRQEIKELERKVAVSPKRDEKTKSKKALDLAKQALKEAEDLEKELGKDLEEEKSERKKTEEAVSVYQQIYNAVQDQPERAKGFLEIMEKEEMK